MATQVDKSAPIASAFFPHGGTKSRWVDTEVLAELWAGTVLAKPHTAPNKVAGACWHWKGKGGDEGYGKVRGRLVSWVAWYAANGPIPNWADKTCLCGNGLCHNPAHMNAKHNPAIEALVRENPELSDTFHKDPFTINDAAFVLPKQEAPKTAIAAPPAVPIVSKSSVTKVTGMCPKGHDLSVMGLYEYTRSSGKVSKECLACKRERSVSRR